MKSLLICSVLLTVLLGLTFSKGIDNGSHANQMIMDKMLEGSAEEAFRVWHHIYRKEGDYAVDTREYNQRLTLFRKKMEEVKRHNADSTKTWKKTLDRFADRTDEERRALFPPMNTEGVLEGILNQNAVPLNQFFLLDPEVTTTAEYTPVDWTDKVGPIYDQGNCGSCYAFSSLNAIEANHAIKYNLSSPIKLSRQQVVDCNVLTGGCDGGDPVYANLYSHSLGLMLESDYAYTQTVQACKYDKTKAASYLKGVEATQNPFSKNNNLYNSATLYSILQSGPAVVVYDAAATDSYKSGVVNLAGCTSPSHAVLLVGYGVDSVTGQAYWLIKNSWGTWWGEKGYFRALVKDDATGNCYLNRFATRPIA